MDWFAQRFDSRHHATGPENLGDGWTIETTPENTEWDLFLAQNPAGDLVQTSLWARVKAGLGWMPVRVLVRRDGSIVGGGQLLIRSLPLVGEVAYLPRGPVTRDDPELDPLIVELLQTLAKRRRVRHLSLSQAYGSSLTECGLTQLGFHAHGIPVSPPATLVIDLARDLDQILAAMHRTTRYNTRLSGRKGVVVRDGDGRDIDIFYDLLSRTSGRRNFAPLARSYYHGLWNVLGEDGHATLLIAELSDRPIAAQLATRFGDTVVNKLSVWSGTDGDSKPNEAIQWASIQKAKAEGYRWYDFEGIDPVVARALQEGRPPPKSSMPTNTLFKLGFGGEVRMFSPSHAYIPNRVLRLAYRAVANSGWARRYANKLAIMVRTMSGEGRNGFQL